MRELRHLPEVTQLPTGQFRTYNATRAGHRMLGILQQGQPWESHQQFAHFTDEGNETQKGTQLTQSQSVAWSPELQLWSHSVLAQGLRLLPGPGRMGERSLQCPWPTPPAPAAGLQASGCVCWGGWPQVRCCCSIVAQILPPSLEHSHPSNLGDGGAGGEASGAWAR